MGSWKEHSDTGQFLSGTFMLGKGEQVVTIASAQMETVGQDDERLLVLRFKNRERGMIIKRTNGDTLAEAFGDDWNDWVGKTITLYVIPNVYQGKPGLRIRPQITEPADEEFTADALAGSDDLPF
jgi:hypothetical protein